MRPRLVVLAALVAGILATTAAAAQEFNTWSTPAASWGSGWCPRCYVVGNMDVPNSQSGWTGAIIGWGGECYSGDPIDRVDVYYSNATESHRVKAFTPYLYLTRDDVSRYFAAGGTTRLLNGMSTFGDKTLTCPAMQSNTGWAIVPYDIPAGTWKLTVVMRRRSIASTTSTFVTVQ